MTIPEYSITYTHNVIEYSGLVTGLRSNAFCSPLFSNR